MYVIGVSKLKITVIAQPRLNPHPRHPGNWGYPPLAPPEERGKSILNSEFGVLNSEFCVWSSELRGQNGREGDFPFELA